MVVLHRFAIPHGPRSSFGERQLSPRGRVNPGDAFSDTTGDGYQQRRLLGGRLAISIAVRIWIAAWRGRLVYDAGDPQLTGGGLYGNSGGWSGTYEVGARYFF